MPPTMDTPSAVLPHLLSLRDLSHEAWQSLLADADVLAGPRGREPLLRGRRCGMVFFQASLRTRVALEVACFDLGAHAVYLQVGGGLWALEHRDGIVMDGEAAEHVREGILVLGRMVDVLGVRCFAALRDAQEDAQDSMLRAVSDSSTVPVLSLESAMGHPHQGLADALTVRRRIGAERARVVVTWAPHVKPLPMAVPHSAVMAFAHEGHELVITHPEGFDLDSGVLSDARAVAQRTGGSVTVTQDRHAALSGARVVYAKSWGRRDEYGHDDGGATAVRRHPDWVVDGDSMRRTDQALFMHCLPIRRGVVATEEVLGARNCVVVEQGAARLDVQKATLCRALGVEN